MNKAQRKILEPLLAKLRAAADEIENTKSEIEAIRDEEQEKYDNMPDGLKSGDKGEALDTIVQALSAICDFEIDGLTDAVDELEGAL